MAWTDPRTWTTGEIVTASIMNTHVRDNLGYLYDSDWHAIDQAAPSAAIISFTSIPGTFRDLRIILQGRGNAAVVGGGVLMRINGDTGSNYDRQYLQGSASTAAAGTSNAQTSAFLGEIVGTSGTANRIGMLEVVFPSYPATTFEKMALAVGGASDPGSDQQLQINSIGWRSTAAITQIDLHFNAINTGFVAGTIATLEVRGSGV